MERLKDALLILIAIPICIVWEPFRLLAAWNERRHWPQTKDEAVDHLIRELNESDLERIRRGDDLDWYSFGQGIRNSFGLWGRNESLLRSCGVDEDLHAADHASEVIIHELQRRLRSQS